jgi:hypothetical protein
MRSTDGSFHYTLILAFPILIPVLLLFWSSLFCLLSCKSLKKKKVSYILFKAEQI